MRAFFVVFGALTAMMTGLAFAADVGRKADVAAVRTVVTKPAYTKIAEVHVAGNYALAEGSGADSDFIVLYKRISGEKWKQIAVSNIYSISNLVKHFGVPTSVAHQLCSGWADRPCVSAVK
jgi:hypothetical protein